MAFGGNGQCITYGEIEKTFMINQPYGTTGAYPSQAIIASNVWYGFLEADTQNRKYVFRNISQGHSEWLLIQQIRKDIQEIESDGGKRVTQIDLRLFQNYSPCRRCASDIIEFIQEPANSGRNVNITILFANSYGWIGKFGYGPKNMTGLRELRDGGVGLHLLHGKDNWETLFNLVDLSDNAERQKLLDRASSGGRREREEEDRKLWEENVLQTPDAAIEALGVEMGKLTLKTDK